MEHDPRPRYLAGGALFLVVAIFMLIVGLPLVTLLLAVVAAGLFYYMTKVKTVPWLSRAWDCARARRAWLKACLLGPRPQPVPARACRDRAASPCRPPWSARRR